MKISTLLTPTFEWGWAKGVGLGATIEKHANVYSFNLIFLCFWFEVAW